MIGCTISVEDFLLALKRYREEVGTPQLGEAKPVESEQMSRRTATPLTDNALASGKTRVLSTDLEAPKPQRQASAASKMPPDDRTAAATPRNGASKKEEARQKKREARDRQGSLW